MLRPRRCAHCLESLADDEGVERYECTTQVPSLFPQPGNVAGEVIGPTTHAVVIYRVCCICSDLGTIWGMYEALRMRMEDRGDGLVSFQRQLAAFVQGLVAAQPRP